MLYDISDSNLNRIDELPNIDDKKIHLVHFGKTILQRIVILWMGMG